MAVDINDHYDNGASIKVLDKGYVKYIEHMGSDESFVEAARMSTGKGFLGWYWEEDTWATHWCTNCETQHDGNSLPVTEDGYLVCTACWTENVEEISKDREVACAPDPILLGRKGQRRDLAMLEYLYSNRHSTPFEMGDLVIEVKAPIEVFRQWHRHRTQCLAGDTKLHFDLPGGIERRGSQKYTLTINEVFEKFQPTIRKDRPERQTNPFGPRQRIQNMRLRCVNEETKEVTHTTIVDVWESGTKPVFEVEVESIGKIRCSKDHRFFTPLGWRRLEEIVRLPTENETEWWPWEDEHGHFAEPEVFTVFGAPNESIPFEVPTVEVEEEWRPVVGWEEYYEVSNMGRVRRIAGGQGVRTQGTTKKLSPDMAGYLCTTLNRPGKQIRAHIHRLVLEAFSGPCPEGMGCRHLDGNQMNNWLSNLKWGTPQENADDRVRHGRVPSLKTLAKRITSVKYVGEEMTYDIEVADPWHNFVAEGFVVHNSYNEFSARYSMMPDDHYVPELHRIKYQATANKQSSAGPLPRDKAEAVVGLIQNEQALIYKDYEAFLEMGVAKEVARINTPVSRYSKMRAKANIRNWLSFLSLRMEVHAQEEIREYANAVAAIIKQLFPRTFELFLEWDLLGERFSRLEMRLLRKLVLEQHMEVFDKFRNELGIDPKRATALLKKFTSDKEDLYKEVLEKL